MTTSPRVRACTPPRMAVLVDGVEHPIYPTSLLDNRTDSVCESRTSGKVTIGPGSAMSNNTTLVLAWIKVPRGATTVHDSMITPNLLMPLDGDWVSPTGVPAKAALTAYVARAYSEPEPEPFLAVSAVEHAGGSITVPPTPWAIGWLGRALAWAFGGRA